MALYILVLGIITAVMVSGQEDPECPPGMTFASRAFNCMKYHPEEVDFNTARKICKSEGSDLVQLYNFGKELDVNDLLPTSGMDTWHGVVDTEMNGTFSFLSGAPAVTYAPFPSNVDSTGKNCATRNNEGHVAWTYQDCSDTFNFVCERPGKRRHRLQFWIGVWDENEDGSFAFLDGSPLGNNPPFKRSASTPGHRCVATKKKGWYSKRCSKPLPYICEKPFNEPTI